jgi:MFS family permease
MQLLRNVRALIALQIFSFISVGELLAPVLGGVLYDKAGYSGVFGLGSGILAVDFIMRILLIEKKTAARYSSTLVNAAANPRHHSTENGDPETNDDEADEEDALLSKKEDDDFKIPEGQNRVVRSLPILYCLSDPRLLTALFVAFVQATLLSTFDATIPTEAEALFGFSSLDGGLLFIALDVTYLLLGPLAGWAVDKYGTKPIAVLGFSYLVPTLVLLRLAGPGGKDQIILYSALLALCGVGMAIIGSPSIVEASNVVQKYDKANPEFFGEQGPYAQLYGFNSIFFCAGLTAGPILGGALRDSIGYGNMNAVAAAISGIIAVLSFVFIGGTPKFLSMKRR